MKYYQDKYFSKQLGKKWRMIRITAYSAWDAADELKQGKFY
jgi:hypothetical protein